MRPIEQRIADKIRTDSGCWLWTGYTNKCGYGVVNHDGAKLAHRVAFEVFRGPIPHGMELDHLCRVRNCVNPQHMEPVPHAVNVRRGVSGAVSRARGRSLTHCKRGHEFTPANTLISRDGRRGCRECKNARQRRRWIPRKDRLARAQAEA